MTGLLFGDKGYIKQDLFHELFDRGLKLVTKPELWISLM
ncbi:transposase [Wolbachia endosymbiont (group E) of Neria commutata]